LPRDTVTRYVPSAVPSSRRTTSFESLAVRTVIGCVSRHTCGACDPKPVPLIVSVSFARSTVVLRMTSFVFAWLELFELLLVELCEDWACASVPLESTITMAAITVLLDITGIRASKAFAHS
jgi:hypothetical protein